MVITLPSITKSHMAVGLALIVAKLVNRRTWFEFIISSDQLFKIKQECWQQFKLLLLMLSLETPGYRIQMAFVTIWNVIWNKSI